MREGIEIETLRRKLPYYELRRKAGDKIEVDWDAEWKRFDAAGLFDFDLASVSDEELATMRERRAFGGSSSVPISTRKSAALLMTSPLSLPTPPSGSRAIRDSRSTPRKSSATSFLHAR